MRDRDRRSVVVCGLALASLSTIAGCGDDDRRGDADVDAEMMPDGGPIGTDMNTRGRTGINRTPAFISMPPLTGEEGVAYRYAPIVDDLDGDFVTFELAVSPDGMQVSPESGAIYWLPGAQAAGNHAVRLTVRDEVGASAEQEWSIAVSAQNSPPRITSRPDPMGMTGVTWMYTATAEDPDGDALRWELAAAPAGMSVDAAGTVRFTPPGPGGHPAVLRVSDPSGASDEQTLQVAVPVPGDFSPPAVSIDAPVEGARLGGVFEVTGTVDDEALVQYTVRVCAATDMSACRELGRGAVPVVGGVLASGDAGALEPGDVQIVVDAVDRGGLTARATRGAIVEAGPQAPALRLGFVDMVVSVGVADVEIVRTYNGQDRSRGEFGIGWRLLADYETADPGVEPHLDLPAEPLSSNWEVVGGVFGGAVVSAPRPINFVLPDGREYPCELMPEYLGPTTGGHILLEHWNVPPATSIEVLDGSGRPYDELLYINGAEHLERYPDLGVYDPQRFNLTTEFGEVFRYNAAGDLLSYRDETGTEHTWSGSGPTGLDAIVNITRRADGLVTRIEHPEWGDAVDYSYDDRGDLIGVLYTGGSFDGETQSFFYDSGHSMIGYEAAGQRQEQVEYDELGRILRRTDGTGAVTEYTYGDHTMTVTRPSGAALVFTFDDHGRVLSMTDPMGAVYRSTYDGDSTRPASTTDPMGRMTRYEYNETGLVTAVTDATGGRRATSYDAENRPTSYTDEEGRETGFVWGTDGNLTIMGPDGRMLDRMEFDPQGFLTRHVDGLGNVATTTYDEVGRPLTEVSATGRQLSHSYDARGLTGTTTDMATGSTFTVREDPSGNVREVTTRTGLHATYDWSIHGTPRRVVGPDGREARLLYDGAGRFAGVSLNGTTLSRVRYDADGQPVSIQNPDGAVQRLDYDPAGRLASLHGDTGIERIEYDATGAITGRTGPTGERLDLSYDMGGRVLEVRDSEGTSAMFGYDRASRRTHMIDGAGRVTAWAYDDYGTLIGEALPGMGMSLLPREHTRFSPDETEYEDEPPSSWTTPAGQTWSFEREPSQARRLTAVVDPLGRRTEMVALPGDTGQEVRFPGDRTWRFEHDPLSGRLARTVSPEGLVNEFNREADGSLSDRAPDGTVVRRVPDMGALATVLPDGTRLVVRHGPTGVARTESPEGTVEYAYDASGRVARVRSAGAEARYFYDEEGNLAELTLVAPDGRELTTRYVWNNARLVEMEDPDGGVWSYRYDVARRLNVITRPNGTQTEYTYGPLPRPTAVAHLGAGGAPMGTHRFGYDGAGRMIEREGPDGTFGYAYNEMGWLAREESGAGVTAWEYDAFGNVVRRTVGGTPETWSYDRDDRLLSIGGTTFSHDGRGNRTLAGGAPLVYDALDRLVEAGAVRYGYDAQGQLVRRETAGGTTRCLFAPHPFVGLDTCLLEHGGPEGVRAYVFDSKAPASRHGDDGTRYVHTGLLHSVVAVTDETGAERGSYSYEAWGRRSTSGEGFLYGYTGEIQDADTGLVYLRSRWYDPESGRFLTMDRAAANAHHPPSYNRYAYLPAGSPLNEVDPAGTQTMGEVQAVQGIQGQMRAIQQAALQCAQNVARAEIRAFAIQQITRYITDRLMRSLLGQFQERMIQLLIESAAPSESAIIGALRAIYCGYGTRADLVQFEYPINYCGQFPSGFRAYLCGEEPPEGIGGVVPAATGPGTSGARIDIVLNATFPMEVKWGTEIKQAQVHRNCRFAADRGGFIAFFAYGDWPPGAHGRRTPAQQQADVLENCTLPWGSYLSSSSVYDGHGEVADGCPNRVAVGGLPIMFGIERRTRQIRTLLPDAAAIRRLRVLCGGV